VLRRALETIAEREGSLPASQRRHDWPALHLLKHFPELIQFLSSDRFRRDPRQVANAFAGVPSVSVWRSLKLCQADPCNNPIGSRAIRSYIRRKHPELYQRLLADYSLVNFATALKSYRSKDQKLNQFGAQYLFLCWKQCTPESWFRTPEAR